MTPFLKSFFVVSYVVLAAFVGAFADSMPKGRVMFITNTIKLAGAALMFLGSHPLLAYGVVGFGAAAYSPAKYGILTELLPPEDLVRANGWIEGLTVASIVLGTAIGGILISQHVASYLLSFDAPYIETGIHTGAQAAIAAISTIYLVAAIFNLHIVNTGVHYPKSQRNPIRLFTDFAHCFKILWLDRLGRISLAVTTLFWGAGATLQFIVLEWARRSLGLSLSEGSTLQAVVAIGVTIGALVAGRVPLKKCMSVLPVGIAMGLLVIALAYFKRSLLPDYSIHLMGFHLQLYLIVACFLLITIGAMAGFFLVPMNALLQHRGYVLMSAGHSIAVQNFNENVSVLVMLSVYGLLVRYRIDIQTTIVLFGIFVCGIMLMIMRHHRENQREFDSVAMIGVVVTHHP
jgi:LPLT family lysophospholipid transporter-like MFS transporter